MSVHRETLRGLDLNLLPVLDALLSTGSVTRAATRLHLSQPAVSHALRRLRQALGDPLFVRGAAGLEPTPFGRQIEPALRRLLAELADVLSARPAFDGGTARRSFSVAMTDYVALLLMPPLMEHLRLHAPGVTLDARLIEQPEWLALERGAVEMAVLLAVEERPGLRRLPLFSDEFVCVVREGHPAVGRQLPLERYLELSHLLISPQGQGVGFVDAVLTRMGLGRSVALRLPYFLAAPLIIARTDLVLTLPRRMARTFAAQLPLRLLPPPLELGGFRMDLVWHERHQGDAGHLWLRQLMQRMFTGEGEPVPAS